LGRINPGTASTVDSGRSFQGRSDRSLGLTDGLLLALNRSRPVVSRKMNETITGVKAVMGDR
jgi:hypothetical protein